jgi:hypothetical protein
LLGITCAHQIGQPVENSVQVGTALIVLHRLSPVWAAYALESIVNEGDPRADSNASKRDY